MRRSWTLVTVVTAALVATVATQSGVVQANPDIPQVCPAVDPMDRTIHIPHEWDCTKFYKCDHGKKVLFQCPVMNSEGDRLYFDPVLQVCNWPNVVDCVSKEPPTTTEGGASTEPTLTTNPKSSSGTSIKPTQPSTKPTPPSEAPTKPTEPSTEPTPSSEVPTKPTEPNTEPTPSSEAPTTPTEPTTGPTPSSEVPTKPTEPSTEPTPSSEAPTKPTEPSTEPTPSSEAPTTPTEPTTRPTPSSEVPTKPTEPSTEPTPSSEAPSSSGTTPASNQTEITQIPTDHVGQNSTPTPSGNFVPHESNCTKFYEIVDGKKILRECARGLQFSPTHKICMRPSEAGCESTTPRPAGTTDNPNGPGSCGEIGNKWVVSHECVCSKYYLCSDGDLILKECPEGLHFGGFVYGCVKPELAGCESTTGTPVPPTVEIPTECPPDNSGPPVHLPYPGNCSLYYMCDNGRKEILQCPANLHFNPQLQLCDWADSAGCEVNSTTVGGGENVTKPTRPVTDGDTDTSSTTQGTPGLPSSTSQDTTRPPSSTVQDTTRPPSSTTQDTTRPSSSTTQETTRPPSSTSQDTTRPPSSTVQDTTRPPSSTTQDTTRPSSSTTQETTRPPSSTSQETTRPPSSTVQDTTRPPSSTTQDTTRPSSSTTQETTRPPSSTSQDTTRPPSSTVQDTTQPPSSTTVSSSISSSTSGPPLPCVDGAKLAHPTNCSLYYECKNDKNVVQECTDGLHFNPVLNICDWWEFAGCNSTTVSSTGSSTPLVPNSSKVTTDDYVGQDTNKPTSSVAPSSTVSVTPSSTESETPRSTETVPPSSTESVTPGLTESVTPSSTESETPRSTESSSTTAQVSTTQKATGPPNCIGSCPARDPMTYTVLLPNEDCTKFCKCSNGLAYVYDCPASLQFNPTKLVCDYPRKAKCTGIGGWGQSNYQVVHASN